MFATLPPVALHAVRPRSAGVTPRALPAAPSLDEAYEARLLAEVARWDDQAAFEELYACHHAAVKRVALAVCRDRCVADEIVQQTFTALWVRAERLVEKSLRLRPWLATVARNAAIDYVRAHRYTADGEPSEDPRAQVDGPEEIVVARESSAQLRTALAALPVNQRRAVELIYFAGMTYQSAAEALGEPVGTVKSRVRLAHGRLRDLLVRAR